MEAAVGNVSLDISTHNSIDGSEDVSPADFPAGRMPSIDSEAAADWAATGILLDARAGERYRGEFEPVDPRAGHIPGAVSAPITGNVDATGRFLPAAELRRRFEDLGIRDDVPVAVYCGSGVTAAHEVAALEIAGSGPPCIRDPSRNGPTIPSPLGDRQRADWRSRSFRG